MTRAFISVSWGAEFETGGGRVMQWTVERSGGWIRRRSGTAGGYARLDGVKSGRKRQEARNRQGDPGNNFTSAKKD